MTTITPSSEARRYGRAAGLLAAAIGSAGFLIYVYFAVASHVLDSHEYGEIVALWAAVFITVSTLFRPVEQLLSRSLAEHGAHGHRTGHVVRIAGLIQLCAALGYLLVALALRGPLEDHLFHGDATLYWIMVVATVTFAGSFFARGLLAGERRFGLYATLLMVDAISRLGFALVVAVGLASGRSVVALGVAAAPALTLAFLPLALITRPATAGGASVAARTNGQPGGTGGPPEFTLAHGGAFAAAVLLMMLSEQLFLNGGVLFVYLRENPVAAGFIFNMLMVARAPVVLFQAVAASLLPHLARLRSRGDRTSDEAFELSIRVTIASIAAFAAFAAVVIVAAGPALMQIAFGTNFDYDRLGLVVLAAGMGLYLTAGTLNQAALAQGKARRASACWVACAIGFVLWNLLVPLSPVRLVELGFAGVAAVLCGLLYLVYRRAEPRPEDVVLPGSPQELEAQLATADELG